MERPDPDIILEKIKEEDDNRGKLKIFFGYAAGVGKTYAMLQAAHTLKENNIDVVVGYIEPHTRPDTMQLLDGLEVLPTKEVEYKGIKLKEFDIDAALKRRPHTILVDEFAHTNAKGSRHNKRWKDIEELLLSGINVYTTLNVQHLESLNDIMEIITNVNVRETVPDKIIGDSLTQIELIDIEPEELLERFKEGKIYKKNQANRAIDNFFVKDNLVALREIALRKTADRVNKEVQISRMSKSHPDVKPTSDILLACISPSESSSKVIRTAYRIADSSLAKWIAIYIKPADVSFMTKESKKKLGENMELAKKLGAEVVILHGESPEEQILRYSKVRNVTKIIIGRDHSDVGKIRRKFKKDIADKLLDSIDNIDIHIIPYRSQRNNENISKNKYFKYKNLFSISSKDLIKAGTITIIVTILAYLLRFNGFDRDNILLVYMLGVSVVSMWTKGYTLGIFSAFVNILLVNYLFTVPKYTFSIADPNYIITLAVFCVIGIITSALMSNIQFQANNASKREEHTQMIYQINRTFLKISRKEDIIDTTIEILSSSLKRDISLIMKNDNKIYYKHYNENEYNLKQSENTDIYVEKISKISEDDYLNNVMISPNEIAVAKWVINNGVNAGHFTDTLSGAVGIYIPIKGIKKIHGVIGVSSERKKIDTDDEIFIETVLAQVSIALDREDLTESREKDKLEMESERLRSNLLRAISHDLRTPLAGISGAVSTIIKNKNVISEEITDELLNGIYEDSQWLIRLVENLLSMTKIDEGKLEVGKEPELVEEVLSESLGHIKRRLSNADINIDMPDELIFVPMDAKLIEQVFINLVDNSLKYSKNNCKINIKIYKDDENAWFEFADNGSGISEDLKNNIFDRFYTGEKNSKDSRKGVGLGLSICKSIINAHGGKIFVDNSQELGGAKFTFNLPLERNEETEK